MTNQEAIETIRRAIAQVEWDYPMEIAAAFDKAIEALGGWISVEDRLPKYNGQYLVAFYNGGVTAAWFFIKDKKFFMNSLCVNEHVKYWQELPNAPKEET